MPPVHVPMLSDRMKKWLRNSFEKLAGSFYQGPKPPEERLRQHAVDFANMYPNATRQHWVNFAAGLAEEVWRSAYVHGLEWSAREDMDALPSPEEVMDQIDPEWRDSPSVLEDPDRIVPEKVETGALQAREIGMFQRVTGRRF